MTNDNQPPALSGSDLEAFRSAVADAARSPLLERISVLQDELVTEAARAAEEKLRADQMTDQHRMQCNIRADLEAQLSAVGAGGVEPLRKPAAQPSRERLQQNADVAAVAALKGLLSLVRREAPHLSGKVLGDAESAIAALQAAPPAQTSENLRCKSVQKRLATMWGFVPAPAGAVPDDLKARCAEILDWQRTGILTGNALRDFAAAHYSEHHDALQMAERTTAREAYAALAAAPAQECGNCFEGKSDLDHTCRKCGGSGTAPAQEHATQLAGQAQEDALDAGAHIKLTIEYRGMVNEKLLSSHMITQAKYANDIAGAHVMSAIGEIDAARAAQGGAA